MKEERKGEEAHVEDDAERPAVDFGAAVRLVVEQLGRRVERAAAERGEQLGPPARAPVAVEVVVGREACAQAIPVQSCHLTSSHVILCPGVCIIARQVQFSTVLDSRVKRDL